MFFWQKVSEVTKVEMLTDDVDEAVAIDAIVITNSMSVFGQLHLVAVAIVVVQLVHLVRHGLDGDGHHEFVAGVDLMLTLVVAVADTFKLNSFEQNITIVTDVLWHLRICSKSLEMGEF